jgi:hypothetical protein
MSRERLANLATLGFVSESLRDSRSAAVASDLPTTQSLTASFDVRHRQFKNSA